MDDAIQRKDRLRSDKTQRRLREMAEIVNKVEISSLVVRKTVAILFSP